MPIRHWQDRRGNKKIFVSKQWPNGTRFRRVMPSATVAKKTEARIEEAIAMGTWPKLKAELQRGKPEIWNPTIKEFSEVYLEEYCRTRNRRPDFKEETLAVINRIVGNVHLREFKRADAHRFVKIRSAEVSKATVNRGVAVLKNLLTFAIDKEFIANHPLVRFKMLPEPKTVLRVLTEEEEARLVQAVYNHDPVVGALVDILGETAMRISEAYALCWPEVDLDARRLDLGLTKNGEVRHVPLSERAVNAFASLVRFVGEPHVFVRQNGKAVKDARAPFYVGREEAGVEWVGFHGLRHFRATQWVKHGMPPREVQVYLGHSSIETTMRYAHFCSEHAWDTARRIEKVEAASRERLAKTWTTVTQEGAAL